MHTRHGLVIGKFWPPHAGHHFLIRAAAATCEKVSVVVMAASSEGLPMAARRDWLADTHRDTPNVRVLAIRDDVPVDYNDAGIWDQHVALMRAALEEGDRQGPPVGAVTAVFTSEPYGVDLARRFNAVPVTLDAARECVPVSGSAVRADPLAHWHHLAPATRAGLARRVVVIGAESTGTTTLSRALTEYWCAQGAPHHETRWIGEYGRDYTIEKLGEARAAALLQGQPAPGMESLVWTTQDFERIARVQNAWEDAAAHSGGPLLICDTDALATAIWHERYLGSEAPTVWAISEERRASLYLVTDDADVPFHQDGIRDGEHLRRWMTGRFVEVLEERGLPFVLLRGAHEERMRRAIEVTGGLLERGWGELRSRIDGVSA